MPGSVLLEVQRAFEAAGIDLGALGFAWARALPVVTLVPAFGLRALPPAARAVLGLSLAAVIAPGVTMAEGAHAARLVEEVARGLSIAVSAAIPLWAATMTGGVIDAVRGSPQGARSPVVEEGSSPLGVPLSILASAIFLAGGGGARVVAALTRPEHASHPVTLAAHDLVAGIGLAVALGAPILAASIVLEVGAALVARATAPAQIQALLAPLRAFAILVVLAIAIDRVADALARTMN